jgi:hypothetical protein
MVAKATRWISFERIWREDEKAFKHVEQETAARARARTRRAGGYVGLCRLTREVMVFVKEVGSGAEVTLDTYTP